jgi:hypothetical protein
VGGTELQLIGEKKKQYFPTNPIGEQMRKMQMIEDSVIDSSRCMYAEDTMFELL